MQTLHPKQAAEHITRLVSEIADFLAMYGTINRPAADVSPQPCDQVDGTVPLLNSFVPERGPYIAPWNVDYSPYTMMFIGSVDVPSAIGFAEIGARLGEHVTDLGWQVHESVLTVEQPGNEACLVVESPTAGYGARIVKVPIASVPLRIGIFASSPCLRHPEAII